MSTSPQVSRHFASAHGAVGHGGYGRPQTRLGAAAATAAAALKAQLNRALPPRFGFGFGRGDHHHHHHTTPHAEDLGNLLERLVIELTPQLSSTDGRVFLSTTSVSPQQQQQSARAAAKGLAGAHAAAKGLLLYVRLSMICCRHRKIR